VVGESSIGESPKTQIDDSESIRGQESVSHICEYIHAQSQGQLLSNVKRSNMRSVVSVFEVLSGVVFKKFLFGHTRVINYS